MQVDGNISMAGSAKSGKRQYTEIRPELCEGETGKLTRHWHDLFLDILAETSNVSEAARRANVSPSRAYKIRREEADFARKWHKALVEGYAHLELETLYRLRMGTALDDNKFDIGSALRLLAMHKETIARERAMRGTESEATILASIMAMRARERSIADELEQQSPPAILNDTSAGID